jgi:hypothetical protein
MAEGVGKYREYRTNIEFPRFFNLSLHDLVSKDDGDSKAVFSSWNENITNEENLALMGINNLCFCLARRRKERRGN